MKNKFFEKNILQNENYENLPIQYKHNIYLISLNDTDKAILICVTTNTIKNIFKKTRIVKVSLVKKCLPLTTWHLECKQKSVDPKIYGGLFYNSNSLHII